METPELNINEETVHYCQVHPDRETELRCNMCERYMCVDCAVRTPVGYRCRECVRGVENRFFTASVVDYLLVAAVIGGGMAGTSYLMLALRLGFFWLIWLFAGIALGGALAQAALQVTQRRRGRYSGQVAAGAAAAGVIAVGVFTGAIGSLIYLIYLAVVVSTVYGRFQVRI